MKPQTQSPPKVCQHDDCDQQPDCYRLHTDTELYEGYCQHHAKEHGMCYGCGRNHGTFSLDEDGLCASCAVHHAIKLTNTQLDEIFQALDRMQAALDTIICTDKRSLQENDTIIQPALEMISGMQDHYHKLRKG